MWSHATKKVYQEENCAFFLETDFSQRTLVVIKFSTTSKLSETLHNFMISLRTNSVFNGRLKASTKAPVF